MLKITAAAVLAIVTATAAHADSMSSSSCWYDRGVRTCNYSTYTPPTTRTDTYWGERDHRPRVRTDNSCGSNFRMAADGSCESVTKTK